MLRKLLLSLGLIALSMSASTAANPPASLPNFSVLDTSAVESSGHLTFTVRKHGVINAAPSTVYYSTEPGTATEGVDYTKTSGMLTFAAGELSKTVTVPLTNDSVVEPDETLYLKIRAGTNARTYDPTGQGTIINDDGIVVTPPAPTTKSCSDGSVIPIGDICPVPEPTTKLCPNGSTVPIADVCPTPSPTTKACSDGSIIPIGDICPTIPLPAPTTKTCSNGSVIPIADTCPSSTKICPSGLVVLLTATCPSTTTPPLTKVCTNGLVVPGTTVCGAGPTTKFCPNGVSIPIADACLQTTKVCPDGNVIALINDCAILVGSPYVSLPTIPSTFDLSPLTPANSYPLPSSSAPDVVGAFRFICLAGQTTRDDPMVYAGHPGVSYPNQFFGNLTATGNSTYSSLRQAGGSSCEHSPLGSIRAANRTSYWMPAMLDGKGNVVRPDFINISYKRRPSSDPKCSLTSGDLFAEGNCIPLPNGLRFIFGYDMLTSRAIPQDAFYYTCDGPTAVGGHYASITEAAGHCPSTPTSIRQANGLFADVYNRLGAVISAPPCWNGTTLDIANHRDHMSYFTLDQNRLFYGCPSTHPYLIPTIQVSVWFSVDRNLGTWHLASDELVQESMPGSTLHFNWFGAWDNIIQTTWTQNCINKLLNCSSGDLGNGRSIFGMWGTSRNAYPRLIPVPQ